MVPENFKVLQILFALKTSAIVAMSLTDNSNMPTTNPNHQQFYKQKQYITPLNFDDYNFERTYHHEKDQKEDFQKGVNEVDNFKNDQNLPKVKFSSRKEFLKKILLEDKLTFNTLVDSNFDPNLIDNYLGEADLKQLGKLIFLKTILEKKELIIEKMMRKLEKYNKFHDEKAR